jgi:predicted dehydrogenase
MVRIGIVGIGFMGYTHFTAAQRLSGGEVTAICTRSRKKLDGDWQGIQGNFGPPAGRVDTSRLAKYEDWAELLRDPEIDLVDICLPPDMHERVAVAAAEAGKAVFVEKPIAVEADAAERMVAAAEQNRVPLMVGQVLPFFPEFRYAADAVHGGQFGKLHAAHFRRVICPPDWSDDMGDFKKLGGWGVDLHIHDNHFISLLCGVPAAVFSRGMLVDGLVNHVHTQYVYEDPALAVTCVSGGIAAKGLQFTHGFELYLERATILYTGSTIGGQWVADRPLTLITEDGDVVQPELPGGGEWCAAFTAELQAAVDGMTSGSIPPVLTGTLARDALKLCYAEAESIARQTAVPIG